MPHSYLNHNQQEEQTVEAVSDTSEHSVKFQYLVSPKNVSECMVSEFSVWASKFYSIAQTALWFEQFLSLNVACINIQSQVSNEGKEVVDQHSAIDK